jgi:NAD(P)H dehydrogenase (quinone)
MSIAVTGATGHLGRLAIDTLLRAGVAAADVIAIVRDPAKAIALSEVGVAVRIADYNDRASLQNALAGVEKLLLISSSELGSRITQHANVIDAAKRAEVPFLAYTSVLHADTSRISLAAEHRATEEAIAASGIDYTFLRNGWYWENFTANVRGVGLSPTSVATAGSRAAHAPITPPLPSS